MIVTSSMIIWLNRKFTRTPCVCCNEHLVFVPTNTWALVHFAFDILYVHIRLVFTHFGFLSRACINRHCSTKTWVSVSETFADAWKKLKGLSWLPSRLTPSTRSRTTRMRLRKSHVSKSKKVKTNNKTCSSSRRSYLLGPMTKTDNRSIRPVNHAVNQGGLTNRVFLGVALDGRGLRP